MTDWRERILANPLAIQEQSAEQMAARRIMKGIGASVKDVGNLCRRFGLEYSEEETTFDRAVKIFRELYEEASLVDIIDVKVGDKYNSLHEDLLLDTRTAIVFYRSKDNSNLTAFVKGVSLMTSPLGAIVIKPGIKFISKKSGVELWEQDPVLLIKSFCKINTEV